MVKVYLAVGHGFRPDGTWDPGTTRGLFTEQSEGRPIVAAMAEALGRVRGITVKHEATGDPNFVGTVKAANDWGADLLVSVHHDWHAAPRGAFGHWWPGADDAERLADEMRDALDSIGWPLRRSWHKPRTDLYLLRESRMTAVLWEADRIGEVAGRHEAYGRALAAGVATYLGRKLPAPKTPKPARPAVQEVHPLAAFEDALKDIAKHTASSVHLQRALVEAEVGELRFKAGLPVDPESDEVWGERIASGTHTRQDAWEALLEKATSGD